MAAAPTETGEFFNEDAWSRFIEMHLRIRSVRAPNLAAVETPRVITERKRAIAGAD
jgi:hypothetical protein